jgi:hypothetical protein
MRTNLNLASLTGLIITMIVAIVGSLYLNVTNPDMTDMRLFLTYWKFYVSVFVAFLTLGITFKVTE